MGPQLASAFAAEASRLLPASASLAQLPTALGTFAGAVQSDVNAQVSADAPWVSSVVVGQITAGGEGGLPAPTVAPLPSHSGLPKNAACGKREGWTVQVVGAVVFVLGLAML